MLDQDPDLEQIFYEIFFTKFTLHLEFIHRKPSYRYPTKEVQALQILYCDGAVAGGRLELGPPVESSDLDEKVLTTTPVRDTSSVRIWVDS